MEWRQQTSVSCADAFTEAQRWIEEVTGKPFGCNDFRAALENGVLLCDLINQLKPGIIKRVNRLSTPIAGLDNVSVFLKACGKLGLNVSQLFHPGDLQDLSTRATLKRDESNRRLKNVLITIFWLGRKAHLDAFYSGPQLNFKAFEGLLGLALSKALDEGGNVFVKDSWDQEKEYLGCGSDAEAEQVFKMEMAQHSTHQSKGYVPPPRLQKQGQEQNGALSSLYQIQVRSERPVQVNPGWIWSKSLTDIPMVYPVRKVPDRHTMFNSLDKDAGMAQDWNQENKRKCSEAAKDSEEQWQDDLTKWKNRRRSTKSDSYRKSQDREHVISQMVNGVGTTFDRNGAQGGLLKRDQQSLRRHYPGPSPYPAPSPYSSSSPSKSSSLDLKPRRQALLTRSYATETPYSPTSPLNTHISTHSLGTLVGSMPASDAIIQGEETPIASLASNGAGVTTPSPDCPFSSQTPIRAQGSLDPSQPTSETTQSENILTHQISTLITTLQPSNTTGPTCSRITSCIDPEAQTLCSEAVDPSDDLSYQNHKTQEDTQKTLYDPAVEQSIGQQAAGNYKYFPRAGSWSGSASLPRGYRRSEGSSRLSSAITARPFGSKQSRVCSLPRLCNVDNNQGLLLQCEKEEYLSPPAESFLKRQTATIHLKSAFQKEHQGQHNGTDQGKEVKGAIFPSQTSFQTNGYHQQPSSQVQLLLTPYSNQQAHHNKTSSLTNATTDFSKVDHSDMRVSLTLKPNSVPDFGFQTHRDSRGVRVKFIQPGSPAELCQLCVDDEIVAVNGVAVAHMNYTQWKDKMTSSLQTGSLTMDIRRYGNKGGSESAISDLQVPSLSPSSSSWSWDHEEDRRRQEKWQEEQERLLQEQYQRDQERLEAEWQRAQRDAMGQSTVATEMSNGSESSPNTLLHVNGLTNKTREEEQSPRKHELKGNGSNSQCDAEGVQKENINEQAWAEDSCSFAQLSPAHRAKSLSTPSLAGAHKQPKGEQRKSLGHSVSQVEKERQQILEEMKKRTQLLTDNSWIRQRSSSFYKEPIYLGVPLKRYESLDNLNTFRQSPVSSTPFSYPRPHSAAAGYCAPTRNSSSRYSTGSTLFQRNMAMEPYHHSSVWAASNTSEEVRLESRFESETGSPTVSPAIFNSSPLLSRPCKQHTSLRITE